MKDINIPIKVDPLKIAEIKDSIRHVAIVTDFMYLIGLPDDIDAEIAKYPEQRVLYFPIPMQLPLITEDVCTATMEAQAKRVIITVFPAEKVITVPDGTRISYNELRRIADFLKENKDNIKTLINLFRRFPTISDTIRDDIS